MAQRQRQQRDTIPLHLPDGREVSLLRVLDPRARHLRLLVTATGPRLTIPPGVGRRQAEAFLHTHLPWLTDQLLEDPGVAPEPTDFVIGQAGTIALRGRYLDLDWRTTRWLQVAQEDDRLVIGRPATARDETVRRALRDFLLAEARADVGRWLPRYLIDLPRPPRAWRIRPLKSLWGSLSSSGMMSLDLALILAPPAAFEYVLVHELCHLLQANHSPAFWCEVERRYPDWRKQRRWLRIEGMALKTGLQRLLR